MAWTTQLLVSSASLVLITDTTQRGFTNHEMLDEVDIIHMNGRIYDGRLGRFLQADPLIQEPNNSQSLNRYSYVINNPLSYTDPTGYNFLKKYWRAIVAIVATYITAGYASGWAASWGFGTAASGGVAATLGNTIAAGAISGFVGGAIATGSFKGAVIGAFTGAAFGALHGWNVDGFHLGKIAAHGGVGGLSSVLSGGKFGHGFAAAGFTQAVSQVGGDSLFSKTDKAGNAVKAALIGGTASAISGGKFANGAVTGAFSRMLNDDVWSRAADKTVIKPVVTTDDAKSSLDFTVEADAGLVNISYGGVDSEGNYIEPSIGVSKGIVALSADLNGVAPSLTIGAGAGAAQIARAHVSYSLSTDVTHKTSAGLCGASVCATLNTQASNIQVHTQNIAVSVFTSPWRYMANVYRSVRASVYKNFAGEHDN